MRELQTEVVFGIWLTAITLDPILVHMGSARHTWLIEGGLEVELLNLPVEFGG